MDGRYLAAHPTWHASDANWKASQVVRLLADFGITPESVVDVGCGTGGVLRALAEEWSCPMIGYDISADAISLGAPTLGQSHVRLIVGPAAEITGHYDLLLALDVLEHVGDYLGFMRSLRTRADWFVFHIPLDLSAQTVIRVQRIMNARASLGHLHYFTFETAMATLLDTGYEVASARLLDGFGASSPHPSASKRIANTFRRAGLRLHRELAARIFGGCTLLVLAKAYDRA
jgi:SAM-dependent methyltransferase